MTSRAAARGLLGAAAALMLLTVRDYGVTWDEPDHQDYGVACVRYYASGLRDVPDMPYLTLYGAAFDLPAALFVSASPLPPWLTRHLLNAAIGWLGLLGTWRLGRLLAGEAAGVWAVLLLAVTPAWWGHQFNNPKDVPFATGYVWAVASLLAWLDAWPAISARLVAGFGVAAGLTMGVRIGGVLLLGYLLAVVGWKTARSGAEAERVPLLALLSAGLAWLVMLAAWPTAQRESFGWPLLALVRFSHYFPMQFSVMFAGRRVVATELPWDYLPRYLLLTLPEAFLVLLGGGAWIAGRRLATMTGWRAHTRAAARYGLVAAAAAVPVAAVIGMRSVVFNGVRHVLFVVPPLAVLAGATAARLAAALRAARPAWRRTALAAAGAWGLWHASVLARLHPLETAYYNVLLGGLPGAYLRYELDYWGNSYPEAIGRLRRYLHDRGEDRPGARFKVASCGAPRAFQAELGEPFVNVPAVAGADFMVGLVGMGCQGMERGPVVFTVDRFGVPLSYGRDLRDAARRR